MYQTSEGFANAILGDNRRFHSKIICNGIEYIDIIRSLKLNSSVCGGGYLTVGGAMSKYIDLELWNPEFTVNGSEMDVYIGLNTSDKEEWCGIGSYTAQTPKKSIDGLIKATAYDAIQSKMSTAYFSDLTYPADAIDVLNEISAKTGVGINTNNLQRGVIINEREVMAEKDVDDSGNEIENITHEKPFNGYMYREALGYIAMLFCKYAVTNQSGDVEFIWYEDVDYEIHPSRYYGDAETSDVLFQINKISCNVGNSELTSGNGTTNIALENPVMTQERLDYIYSKVKDLVFMPSSVAFLGDTRLRCCDIVTVYGVDGILYKVPIMNMYHEFDGGLKTSVASFGGTEQENVAKSPTMTRLDRNYIELLMVKEVVGKKANFDYVQAVDASFKNLSADYGTFKNLTAGKIDALEANIAVINASNITTENLDAKLAEIGVLTADEAVLKYATIDSLNALSGKFDNLSAIAITTTNISAEVAKLGYATVGELNATTARVETLETGTLKTKDLSAEVAKLGYATIAELNATNAVVDSLKTDKLDAETASITYATIANLNATNANINSLTGEYAAFVELTTSNFSAVNAGISNLSTTTLKTSELSAEVAKLGYLDVKLSNIDVANISKANVAELLVEIGLIDSAVISEGHVTGYLDSVAINANNIKAGTLSVDRLVINGTDKSVIFALNNAGDLTSTSVDTLDGGLLTDRTITADKLVAKSITASEIASGTITASEIKTGTITTENISTGAITTDKIATGAVSTEKLEANAVTADKIDVTDLFAQDITATGTITGANLVGAKGSFTGNIKATSGKIGSADITILGLKAYAWDGTIGDFGTGELIYGTKDNVYVSIMGGQLIDPSLRPVELLEVVAGDQIFSVYSNGKTYVEFLAPTKEGYSTIGYVNYPQGLPVVHQFEAIYGKELYEDGVSLKDKYLSKENIQNAEEVAF